MAEFEKTSINRVKRVPVRGKYDKNTVYQIVDQALICHVGFVQDERPYVIPMLHARRGDAILLHGATTSRLMRHIGAGRQLCITMTLVDGLVLARSAFHHSVNYRSAVLFGRGYLLETPEERMDALEEFTERMMPGRWADARPPNSKEMKATAVALVPIDLASAKVRQGPPKDDEQDLSLPVWAGVLPIRRQIDPPVDAPDLQDGIPVPDYISSYMQRDTP
jgi:nitroimidazol reductase NimA-like FMN-containing flavoprotein (pyridoxamine 5'-phosphate oxidase superfamily)